MKIVQINSVCGIGSTGRICSGIASIAEKKGHECKIAYGRSQAPKEYVDVGYRVENDWGVKAHALTSRIFGKTGTYSENATKNFLKWLDEYSPDILHLHNLHGYYINYPMLFDYIKRNKIRTVWTLHDCWAFTGHCAYFDAIGCEKWKDGCFACPQKSGYPKSLKDDSQEMYELKKACFSGVDNMTIVTPSQWLANIAKQSFLKKCDIQIINNGIDLSVFRPIERDFGGNLEKIGGGAENNIRRSVSVGAKKGLGRICGIV